MVHLPRLLTRTTTLHHPGVGRIHLTAPLWAPRRVHAVRYQPEGLDIAHDVPDDALDALFSATSQAQAMAVIRSAARNDRGRPS